MAEQGKDEKVEVSTEDIFGELDEEFTPEDTGATEDADEIDLEMILNEELEENPDIEAAPPEVSPADVSAASGQSAEVSVTPPADEKDVLAELGIDDEASDAAPPETTVSDAEAPAEAEEVVSDAEAPADAEDAVSDAEAPADAEDAVSDAEAPAEAEEVVSDAEAPADAEDAVSDAEAPVDAEDAVSDAEAPAEAEDAGSNAEVPVDAQPTRPDDENTVVQEVPPVADAALKDNTPSDDDVLSDLGLGAQESMEPDPETDQEAVDELLQEVSGETGPADDSVKARIDDDDILAELGLADDKADLDSEGILDDALADKAVLDKEGLPDVSAPVEESTASGPAGTGDAQPAAPETPEAPSGPGAFALLIDKIKAAAESALGRLGAVRSIPLKQIGIVCGGTLISFILGWVLISYYFSPGAPEPVDTQAVEEEAAQPEPRKEPTRKITDGITKYEFPSFLIPLHDPQYQTVFMRCSVNLGLRYTDREVFENAADEIRRKIYFFFSSKSSDDLLDLKRRTQVIKKLISEVNAILQKDVVVEVVLQDLVIT